MGRTSRAYRVCYFQYLKGFYLGLEKEMQSQGKIPLLRTLGKSIFSRTVKNADFLFYFIFFEGKQEMSDVPLLQRFPGQHMPSLWHRFFFLRHNMQADDA